MPANKTQSGLKTNSTKGGGGYNEFMFEDKKDSENIRMHAQKDYNVTILNTETVTIGEKYTDGKNSRSTTLKKGSDDLKIETGDQSIDIIKGNQTVHVKQNQTITVDDEISITATNKITLTVGESSITLEPNQISIKSPTINTESGLKTTVQGGTALDLLAGLIKING
jgi:type VI secretion system secreted protein VgrG